MKRLLIYMDLGDYVIERVNEFDHATKRKFATKEGLLEGLETYRKVMSEYEIEVSEVVWSTVINYLQGEKVEKKSWCDFSNWNMDEPSFMD